MNSKLTLILLLLIICVFRTTHAQVTIGSNLKPNEGALLDLKEFDNGASSTTGTKGLLLPRVKLTDVKPDLGKLAESIGNTGSWIEAEHTGLMVYNVENTMTPQYVRGAYPGVYLWNGSEWKPIFEKKATVPPTVTTDEFVGANSYILAAGGSSVEIPAKRGKDIWQAYTGTDAITGKVLDINTLGAMTSYAAQIVWQEADDASNNDVVATVQVNGTSAEPILKVTSGSKTGNALVSLSNGSTGEVIWMWHIWVAENDPTDSPLYFINSAGKEYWLMQTNLGALNANKTTYNNAAPTTASSHGLYYQWGRHIPFRQFVDNPTYSPGTGISEKDALTYALQNPDFIRYFNIASHDWYSSSPNSWNTRWTAKNAQAKNIKSPFDPCPYGWRIPDMELNESAWQGLDNASVTQVGSGIDTSIGYFPYSGYLADGDGKLGSTGQSAYIWSANSYLGVNASNLFVAGTTIQSEYGMNKADALSVRCVKDIVQ